MNRINRLIFACLFAVVAVSAQGKSMHFGIHVGLGYAGLNHAEEVEELLDGETGKLLAAIGGVVSMPLSDALTFTPELLFSYAAMPGERPYDVRFDIPVLLRFYALDYFFLQFGPQLGFSVAYVDDSGKSNKYRNTFDAGPVFGLGYLIDSNTSIDIRYYYGVTKYFDVDEARAQSFQITAGFSYLF